MITKIKELFLKYKELIVYAFFGVLTTVVNIGVFWLLSHIFGDEKYLLINIIAWVCAVAFSYITNKIWVFESKSWKIQVLIKELVSFFAARLFTLGIEEAGLFVLVDTMSFSEISIKILSFEIGGELIAKALIAVVVVVVNYVFSKLVVFRRKK